jgi:hypothetical protein
MGLHVPNGGNEWGWSVSNVTGQPDLTPGTDVTPGASNSMGSWTQTLSALAYDAYLVEILISGGSSSGSARDMLVDIGADPAGGSSYSVIIPTLLGSCAFFVQSGPVLRYLFPLRIAAGSTIAARAQVNNGTAGGVDVQMACWGLPREPLAVKAGSFVTAYGITAASSSGTSVTSGTSSEGSWTELGTVGSDENPWWWQVGMGVNDSSMSLRAYDADLAIGDGSNQDTIISGQRYITITSEALGCTRHVSAEFHAAVGAKVAGRLQCSGTPDSNLSMAAWAVGG